mgnify:CR=1 FL=1
MLLEKIQKKMISTVSGELKAGRRNTVSFLVEKISVTGGHLASISVLWS